MSRNPVSGARQPAVPAAGALARAVSARDAGLRRISRVTRWLTVAAVGLSGALALVASHAFHGRAVANSSSSSAPANAAASATETAPASPGGVQPPAQAPTSTAAAPVAVSGGS